MRKIAGILGIVGLLTFLIPVRADEDAKLREVIARAIKIGGGIDHLKKFKANVSKSKGKFHGLGEAIDYTGETSLQLPNRLRTEVHSKFGDQEFTYIQVIDGNKGWIKIGNKTDEMNEERLAEAKEQMNAANITHLVCLSDKEYKLSPLGEGKVGDRPAIGIRVERKGYRDVNLFFDKEKGLLLKMETRGKDLMRGGEEYTATTLYGDYKKIEGMMVAHKITIKRDDKPFVEGEIVEMKFDEKLDDSVFEKP
jgi:outer membrane lipoprotein-sorting protein